MDASVAIALVIALSLDKKKRKLRRKWSKDWLLQRVTYGHANLLKELRINEPEDFHNFLRMDAQSFDELLSLVEPLIRKQVITPPPPTTALDSYCPCHYHYTTTITPTTTTTTTNITTTTTTTTTNTTTTITKFGVYLGCHEMTDSK